jgi:hypothetical protein
MLRKGLIACAIATMLTAGVGLAKVRVYVGTAPPAAVVETAPPSPGYGYVWTPGYYNYNGGSYAWTNGQWMRAPHGRHHYVGGTWVRSHRGYYYRDGYWRR